MEQGERLEKEDLPGETGEPSGSVDTLASDKASEIGATWRAWWFLVWLCFQQQARARQMVWIALSLILFTTTVIGLITASGGWKLENRRWVVSRTESPHKEFSAADSQLPGGSIKGSYIPHPTIHYVVTLGQARLWLEAGAKLPFVPPATRAIQEGIMAGFGQLLDLSGVILFSNWVVFILFLNFLLPIWSLSFATDSLGGEREGRTLVWLLTRPISRPAIYLAKFVALLPFSVGLNLGGFGLICLAAGQAGTTAFRWYWPAVFWGTITFSALFHLLSALFQRPAIVGLVYSFFLETFLGTMPGYFKRMSISYYIRCMMFEPLRQHGISLPEKEAVYLPVPGDTAWWILAGGSLALLGLGMIIFSRKEYRDLT